jgi:hypothetical protein
MKLGMQIDHTHIVHELFVASRGSLRRAGHEVRSPDGRSAHSGTFV